MEHMGRDDETKKRMEAINEELKEKEEELDDLEALTQTLIIKERKCNDELQEARKEMITVSLISFNITNSESTACAIAKITVFCSYTMFSLQGLRERKAYRANFGVKLVGYLDEKVIDSIAKTKYSKEEARTKSNELFSLWKGLIDDPEWQPFKVLTEDGVSKVYVLSTVFPTAFI